MKLSVITATYNAFENLPFLIDSLRCQVDKDFEWIVSDGGSTDGTLQLLNAINDLNIKIISREDFGIYDALNNGIKASTGEFYLVLGSDDIIFPEAVYNYKVLLENNSDTDVVTALVKYKDNIHPNYKIRPSFLTDAWSYVGCHSVGCVFKKTLHERFGYYSKRFPIAADQYFIKKIVDGGVKISHGKFVAGEFGSTGVSSSDVIGHLTETFRIQYETESNKSLQLFLFFLRLLKNKILRKI